jgi:hypothetical protein
MKDAHLRGPLECPGDIFSDFSQRDEEEGLVIRKNLAQHISKNKSCPSS